MRIFKTLIGIFLITWVSESKSMVSGDDGSAYEMLEKFNFPKGILPQGVKGYVLHEEDNRFEVFLDRDCKFWVEEEGGYSLYYKRKITGKVGFGSLRELQGVSVKVFFIWLSISAVINRGDGNLDFYVGPMSASFPLSNFEESPQCSCQMVSDS